MRNSTSVATCSESRPSESFVALSSIWVLVMGSAGIVLAGLWGFTDHAAAYYNENVLQANLLAVPLLWLIPRSVLGPRSVRPALALAVVVAGLSCVGLMLKLFPQFYQVSGSVIALALPVHAGVAAGLWRLARD